jgi:regulator of RNase E activity RraA
MNSECPSWSTDAELFTLARANLYSAVIGDILDEMGYLQQFLPPYIQPLRDDHVVCGRAMPVLETDDIQDPIPSRKNAALARPFGLMLTALDDLQADEVYVCSGSSPTYALWGELMSTCAMNRGAAGAVVDGWSRDTRGILSLNFPCFSRGRYAQDQRPRGKVIDFRCRIKFGDVVPRAIETEVIRRAWAKAFGEKRVFNAIKSGMGAQAAWDTYGIL